MEAVINYELLKLLKEYESSKKRADELCLWDNYGCLISYSARKPQSSALPSVRR